MAPLESVKENMNAVLKIESPSAFQSFSHGGPKAITGLHRGLCVCVCAGVRIHNSWLMLIISWKNISVSPCESRRAISLNWQTSDEPRGTGFSV